MPPIKFCYSRTDPAAETESIGLPADAQLYLFLHRHLDNFIVTRKLSSIYRDCAKTNPTATLTATNHTAGR